MVRCRARAVAGVVASRRPYNGARGVYRIAPPNNGMHPTADTTALMFLQRCGAAGDARVMPLSLNET